MVALYDLRWRIELFFNELESTLGMHPYRFTRFDQVDHWVELSRVAFLYLEWYRLRQLRQQDLCDKEKRRRQCQRTHGLCIAVQQAAEREDLRFLAEALETPSKRQRLARKIEVAVQHEYRAAG